MFVQTIYNRRLYQKLIVALCWMVLVWRFDKINQRKSFPIYGKYLHLKGISLQKTTESCNGKSIS